MGSKFSSVSFEQAISTLGPNNFTRQELKGLFDRFNQLSQGQQMLNKMKLLELPELQLNPLADRMIDMLVENSGMITFNSFVVALSPFSPTAPDEEKLSFVFKVYDKDNDGFINADELFGLLKQIVGYSINDVQLQMLVKGTITDADTDRDGKLNYEEFKASLQKCSDIRSKITVKF
ncbi:Calcineurin regulatory subunit B [Spironucleus salmonicida]|uniref:Calcineurin regulatory subunit B n=1 Tax=Spironucleus salmonicida TaxID=348837 RepID=V6LQY9_9EUKA|nr:Calcineurin regulatory subunit B [Spironucleus salmonicida]|eukprot:EST47010.1 Calcineurin regulatory subunit B [Spironucleus salmonicida]